TVLPALLPRCSIAGHSPWVTVYTSRMTPLGGDELGIRPVGSDQVGVASAGDHLPPVDHDHTVGREDGRESVRNDQGGASRHQAGDGGLDQPLVLTVQVTGGLV